MQKKIIMSVLLFSFIGFLPVYAGESKGTSINERITKDVLDQVSVKIEPISSKVMRTVFKPKFYNIIICINTPGSPYIEFNYGLVYEMNNILTYLQMPTGDQELSQYLEIINDNFLLKSSTSASVVMLEKALELIEPVSTKGNKLHRIKHSKNKWTFIRSKFFDNYSGYIFHTDDKGKIIKVEYSMDIK